MVDDKHEGQGSEDWIREELATVEEMLRVSHGPVSDRSSDDSTRLESQPEPSGSANNFAVAGGAMTEADARRLRIAALRAKSDALEATLVDLSQTTTSTPDARTQAVAELVRQAAALIKELEQFDD